MQFVLIIVWPEIIENCILKLLLMLVGSVNYLLEKNVVYCFINNILFLQTFLAYFIMLLDPRI